MTDLFTCYLLFNTWTVNSLLVSAGDMRGVSFIDTGFYRILSVIDTHVSIRDPYSLKAMDWEMLTLSASFAFPVPTLASYIFSFVQILKNKRGKWKHTFFIIFSCIQVLSSWLKFIFMLIPGTSFRLSLTWEMGARLELMTLHWR